MIDLDQVLPWLADHNEPRVSQKVASPERVVFWSRIFPSWWIGGSLAD